MKKISIFILIIALIGISTLTVYTLTRQNVKGDQVIRKVKSIEKATSNMTENELSETYNVELNGKRHRLKCVYLVVFEKKEVKINLTLYLDGFEIYNKDIENNSKAKTIEEVFEENSNLRIEEANIQIIESDKDYLLIDMITNLKDEKEEYFVWNDKRNVVLENILVYDQTLKYDYETEEENIFYDEEKQVLAKIEDNTIFALEEKEEEDTTILEEYKYTIKNNKAEKELINRYEPKK